MRGDAVKIPEWLVIETLPNQPGDDIDVMRVRWRVRRWHPGYWLMKARVYWHVWCEAGK